MKARDVHTDYMHISRPVTLKHCCVIWKADSGQVVGQGIEPHIDDVLRVARERDAPGFFEPVHAPRYGEIAQPLPDHAQYLRPPHLGHDKVRVFVDVRKQAITILREGEKVILLL